MIPGRDNLELINQHIYQAQAEQEQAGRRLQELYQQLDALRQATSEGYRELARQRLNDLQAREIIARLDETDQLILSLLEKLKDTRKNLDEQIAASLSRQRQLEAHRRELERRRDEAGQALERQQGLTSKRLQETEVYRTQQQRAQAAAAVVKQAEDKASRAEKDRIEKGKPYEADRLFMYLWNRRFLTPDYRGGFLVRQLDNWVARSIDFQRNRANYYMLMELPRRLREHAARVQQTAQLELQALQSLEKKAADADGIFALQAKAQEADQQIKQIDADLEAEEARHQKLLQEQSDLLAGRDSLTKQILDLETATLEREPLPTLYRKAQATPRPEDDVIVTRIDRLKQQQTQVEAEIKALNNYLQERLRNLGDLEEVRRRYRRNGYDSYGSRFPQDFSLEVLLGQMLGGMMNSDTVWHEIGRRQQGRPYGGGYEGGGGGLGDFSGDAGGDLGGMGGGDFQTGGGF